MQAASPTQRTVLSGCPTPASSECAESAAGYSPRWSPLLPTQRRPPPEPGGGGGDIDALPPAPGASVARCVVALAFSGIGAGVLTLPWAVSTFGMAAGLAVLCATALLSAASLSALVDAQDRCGAATYAGVVSASGLSAAFVNAVILTDCWGAMVVFVDFCAQALLASAAACGMRLPLLAWKAGVCLLLAPLTLPRDITHAAVLAPLCVCALMFVCALVVRESFLVSAPIAVAAPTAMWLQGAAVFFFAFVCHMNLFSVLDGLHDPTPARRRAVTRWAAALMLAAYAAVAAAGYAAFGAGTRSDVLLNFGPGRPEVRAANAALVAMLFVCLILVTYPVRSAALDLAGAAGEPPLPRWVLATAVVCAATAGVSTAFPSVVSVLGVLGGVNAPLLVFAFPAATLPRGSALRAALLAATVVGFAAAGQAIVNAALGRGGE